MRVCMLSACGVVCGMCGVLCGICGAKYGTPTGSTFGIVPYSCAGHRIPYFVLCRIHAPGIAFHTL